MILYCCLLVHVRLSKVTVFDGGFSFFPEAIATTYSGI